MGTMNDDDQDRVFEYFMAELKWVEGELPLAQERGDAERVRKLEWLVRYYNDHLDALGEGYAIRHGYAQPGEPGVPWIDADGSTIPF
jgi:hypothetical protein